jgi:hypothetical protein
MAAARSNLEIASKHTLDGTHLPDFEPAQLERDFIAKLMLLPNEVR